MKRKWPHWPEKRGIAGIEQLNNVRYLKDRRKKLRNSPTESENHLWRFLKGKQLEGRKFRRQHSFGNYILDFYCPAEKLAVELDGSHHWTDEEVIANDKRRTEYLNAHGIRVLRFSNQEVINNTPSVLQQIAHAFRNGKSK